MSDLPDTPARLTDPDGPPDAPDEEVVDSVFGDEGEASDFVAEGPGASSFGQWRNIR